VNPVITWLGQAVVASGIASIVLGIWLKSVVDEKLDKSKTRFAWLYQTRAKSMMSIYARIMAVEDQVKAFVATKNLEPSENTSHTIGDRLADLRRSILLLDNHYRPRSLLFSPTIAMMLDMASAEYHRVLDNADAQIDERVWITSVYDSVDAVAKSLPDTEPLRREIGKEFRAVYGSEEPKAKWWEWKS
jgi:hypothetical protein